MRTVLELKGRSGSWVKGTAIATLLAAGIAGCTAADSKHSDASAAGLPPQAAAGGDEKQVAGAPASDQETFNTPDAAVAGLLNAVQADDRSDLHKIFGPDWKDLVSGDPVADANSYKNFAQHVQERAMLEQRTPTTAVLHIGENDWSFPIPIEKDREGKWFFDTAAGEKEILARRIGANELETISICRAYVQAQREYASIDHNKDEVLEYAQRLRSSPGKQDGLYWPAKGNQPESPFGPLVAEASGQGYAPITGSRKNPEPFHGYYYHILKAQGPAAPGGAYNYVINGHMIAGFGLIAWPAEYGKSGVMTFIVNHQGKVYQRNLGANTAETASRIREYNPDKSWSLVKE